MITPADQAALKAHFAEVLTSRLRLDVFTRRPSPIVIPGRPECPYCDDLRDLMREVAGLSPRISLTEHDFDEEGEAAQALGVDMIPATVLRGATNRPIRFFGMPTGANFPAFIEAVTETATGTTGLDPAVVRQLRKLREEVSLRVLVVPSCTHSPAVMRTAIRLALHNVKVRTEIVEIVEFPELIQRYRVVATPTIIINETIALPGSLDEAALVDCLLRLVEGKFRSDELALGPSTPFGQAEPEEERRGPSGLIIPR